MNGVEILNQTNIYYTDGYSWLFWVFVGAGFLVGLIYMITQWVEYGFDGDDLCALFGSTAIGLLLGIFAFMVSLHDTDELKHVEYQVIVSDEVSLSEFTDKYEIIDQEGKIYTVKERE